CCFFSQSQMISHHGYPSEEYEVLTEDGYYLTINRIPWGRKNIAVIDPKSVVFLQHGISGEASHWVENMANNSLGFILADAGYDVWLGNSRGTSMSQRHQTFSVDQEEFWNFSFHEMAMYDLPATINFILKKTKQKQLYYVGYSQGATIGMIKWKTFSLSLFYSSLSPSLSPSLFLSPTSPSPSWYFMKKLCTISFMHKLCTKLMFFPDTYNTTNLNMVSKSSCEIYFSGYCIGCVSLNFTKVSSRQKVSFQRMESSPPSYQIKDLLVPTAVWSGGQDTVADPKDIKLLLSGIVNLVYHCSWADWTHWDFIWGLNAPQRMFFKIIQLMEKSV
uniref:Partial AB-hydrolase lipase domain-containing protein n=1 Tax=Naja naja TaxID=35670 RepID=A0A8C6XA06_NAJNA